MNKPQHPAGENSLKKGLLLVAAPYTSDPIFSRSTVLLFDNDSFGLAGLILNRPTQLNLGDIFPYLKLPPHIPVFCGGPVSIERLYYLHTLGNDIPQSISLGNGWWIDGDFNAVVAHLKRTKFIFGEIAFFLGYTEWQQEDLLQGIASKTWAVSPTQGSDLAISVKGELFWKQMVQRLGSQYQEWLTYPRFLHQN